MTALRQTENDNHLDTIRKYLGIASEKYLSDDRIQMMFLMTNGDYQQTCLMALGYLIQTLKLQGLEASAERKVYAEKLDYLQRHTKTS